MATEEDWYNYRTAVVDIDLPGGEWLRISPAMEGVVGAWPEQLDPPVFVITAWNPDSQVRDPAVNRAQQEALESELDLRGVDRHRSVGRDLGTPHFEVGSAVVGLDEEEALAIGRRFGQAAVYRWTPEVWEVVSCAGDRRHPSGWEIGPVPSGS